MKTSNMHLNNQFSQNILEESQKILNQLLEGIQQLEGNEFKIPISLLGNASIGQHVRHIIELYRILLDSYETGTINYDKRMRDIQIESSMTFASQCISQIISQIWKENKILQLKTGYIDNVEAIETNYYRELLYQLEHCIHHQAIIKIGIQLLGKDLEDKTFGVAKSTQIFKNQENVSIKDNSAANSLKNGK